VLRYALHSIGLAAILVLGAPHAFSGQERFSYQDQLTHGQNIAPAFEGWEANEDGTFNMVFGYYNRNRVEQPDVPIGPNNNIEPRGPDQGQPSHFFPSRNMFVFRVKVPRDFGNKELVWTLTVHGKTERAYATLKPDYVLDDFIMHRNFTNTTPKGIHQNKRPVITVEGDTNRTARVGQPLTLSAHVIDDGLLAPRPAASSNQGVQVPGYSPAWGLRVAWFVYRGAGSVTFDPEQFEIYPDTKGNANSPWRPGWAPPPLPPDGNFPVKVTFGASGAFVVRIMAHDGGVTSYKDVNVTVSP